MKTIVPLDAVLKMTDKEVMALPAMDGDSLLWRIGIGRNDDGSMPFDEYTNEYLPHFKGAKGWQDRIWLLKSKQTGKGLLYIDQGNSWVTPVTRVMTKDALALFVL